MKRWGTNLLDCINYIDLKLTGLPQARKDHALAMARFSRDVLVKFHQVIHDLEEILGEGTNKLNLRVGLHSGSVTAGQFNFFASAV